MLRRMDAARTLPYPPPPWRLRGSVVLIPAWIPPARAAPWLDTDVTAIALPGGRGLGGVLLGLYGEGSTLRYAELIAFCALAPTGWVVSHIVVDDAASVAGGRAVWGLPKELAAFRWRAGEIDVRQGEVLLLRARLEWPRVRLPFAALAPFLGRDSAGAPLASVARGVLGLAPVRGSLEVPTESPLAALELAPWPLWLAGRADLAVPAPRRGREAVRS